MLSSPPGDEHASAIPAPGSKKYTLLGADRRPYPSETPGQFGGNRQGQRDREFRDFDVEAVGGVVRSAVTHDMVMRQRDDPGADLGAYAQELVRLFDLGIRR